MTYETLIAKMVETEDEKEKEYMTFFVNKLSEYYDKKVASEEKDLLFIYQEIIEKRSSLTMGEGVNMLNNMVARMRSLDLLNALSEEEKAQINNGSGPIQKWMWIFQNIVNFLRPQCGGGCGSCGGGCGGGH